MEKMIVDGLMYFGINISHDTVIRILRRLPKNLNKVDKTVINIVE